MINCEANRWFGGFFGQEEGSRDQRQGGESGAKQLDKIWELS